MDETQVAMPDGRVDGMDEKDCEFYFGNLDKTHGLMRLVAIALDEAVSNMVKLGVRKEDAVEIVEKALDNAYDMFPSDRRTYALLDIALARWKKE